MSETNPPVNQLDRSLFELAATPKSPTEKWMISSPANIQRSQTQKTPPSNTPKTPRVKLRPKKKSNNQLNMKNDRQELDEEDSEESKKHRKKANHTWTNGQKTLLLTFIINQIALGKGCNNGNIKTEVWTVVVKEMNERFGFTFTANQLKNQKGSIRKLYINQKFLLAQLGFGWDDVSGMVTVDDEVWSALIEAHPKKKFAHLRQNLIPYYDLAKQLFAKTYATGRTALKPGEVANNTVVEQDIDQLGMTGLSANSIIQKKSKPANKEDSLSNDDPVEVASPTNTRTPAPKRV